MNQELFQQTLRSFLQRVPFLPFVVVLRDGRKIAVDEPTVAFAGGAGVYFSPEYDLHDFKCEDVRDIRLNTQEAAS
jgi:hypothetical protein